MPLSDQQRALALQLKTLADVKLEVPGFKGKLDPHQRVGTGFLVVVERAMLLDFVGSGKTIMSIAADLKLRAMGKVKRTLVVCTTQRWQWQDEYKQFSDLTTCLVVGDKDARTQGWLEGQGSDVTICHYGGLRSDIDLVATTCHYDLVIFDEAVEFKTYGTALADALRRLRDRINPRYRFFLTATAIEKTLDDLYSIADQLEPGLLGDYTTFIDTFCIRKKFEIRSKRGKSMSFMKTVGYRNLEQVQAWIQPYYLRRTKEQVGKVLRRVSTVRSIELGSKQRKFYDEIVSKGKSSQTDPLTTFRMAENAVDTLAYFDPNDHTSAKLDDLMFLLTTELKEEKCLIFSKHHKPLDELRLRLHDEQINYVNFSGRENQLTREEDRKRFQTDPRIKLALVTKAAYKGLNFHAARYIIFLNHYYNPAVEEQLIGRIDRPMVQQSEWVAVIHYVVRNSIEEKMIQKMEKERELFKTMFGDLAIEEKISPDQMRRILFEDSDIGTVLGKVG